jgi:hypothetical protein
MYNPYKHDLITSLSVVPFRMGYVSWNFTAEHAAIMVDEKLTC